MAENLHRKLSNVQMRDILNNAALGTPSRNGQVIDKIGVMPDLKKIIRRILKTKSKSNPECCESWAKASKAQQHP